MEELAKRWVPAAVYTEGPFSSPSIRVSSAVMKKITGLPAPDGVAATFPLPAPTPLVSRAPLLVLDRLANPGNVGTLLRTALALGWGGVFFLPGTVDPFHEQVVRASRGALFHLPWWEGTWEELHRLSGGRTAQREGETGGMVAYVADTEGTPLSDLVLRRECLLLLSNEGEGVSQEGAAWGQRITIPMTAGVESLNVAAAGAILMYLLVDKGGHKERFLGPFPPGRRGS